MSASDQFTEAHLADGTTLKLRGDLSPEQVKQKVIAYRSGKADKLQQARKLDPNHVGMTLPSQADPNQTGIVMPEEAGMNQPEPAAKPEGFWHSLASTAGLDKESMMASAKYAAEHPIQTIFDTLGGAGPSAAVKGMIESGFTHAPEMAKKSFSESEQSNEALSKGDLVGFLAHEIGGAGYTGATAASPFLGGAPAKSGEQLGSGNVKGGLGTATGLVAPFLLGTKGAEAGETAGIFARPNLGESAHRMLSDAATRTKQLAGQGGTVHQNVSSHFGRLLDDIAAADYADGKKIDTGSIWDAVTKHSDDYAAGKTTPNFNAIADAIQKRPVEMTFKELHDLKKEVGSRWEKTKTGTRDEAAAGQALKDINSKLSDRAAELGRSKQYDAMNTIWSTLKEYEGNGSLSQLMNTVVDPAAPGAVSEGGKKFFDVLRDPANQPKLKEINKSLEPYGMPKNYFTDLGKSHAPLHNLVAGTASGGGMFGRTKAAMRAVRENPAVGIPAVAAGTTLGGVVGGPIGGTLGAIGALRGVERLSAASAMRKLGGIPPEVNPMAEASQVRPAGGTEPPAATQRPLSPKPAPVPTVNEEEIMSALANQGYPRKTARSMAQRAIQDNPHDFDAALRSALGQKTVSGAKASAIEDVGEEARRGGPGPTPQIDPAQTYVRPSKMGTQQGIADQVKAAKTGKTAETQQRVEQHKVAKKEIGEETAGSKAASDVDTPAMDQALKELFPGKKFGDLSPADQSKVVQLSMKKLPATRKADIMRRSKKDE